MRYLVLSRTKGETAKPISDTLLTLFREGEVHERDIKRCLDDMGYDIHGTQTSFPPNSYQITGHVDVIFTVLMPHEDSAFWVKVGCEAESLNPWHWKIINDATDLRDSGVHWLRKWYTQSNLYAFLSDMDSWLFILKNKMTGEWKILPHAIDLDHVQLATDNAERVNGHIEKDTLPGFLADPAVCRNCKFFGRSCEPPETGSGAVFIPDKSLAALARSVSEDGIAARRYNDARTRLRDSLDLIANGKERMFVIDGRPITLSYTRNGSARLKLHGDEEEAVRG